MVKGTGVGQDKANELAWEHWRWIVTVIEKTFIDAFKHGYGHGYEDAKKEVKDG